MNRVGRNIGIRELRTQLSGIVAAAVAGERITITRRGRPVAVIGPNESTGATVTMESLSATGLVEPPRRRDKPVTPHPHVLPADLRLERVLDQIRGRS